MDSARRLLSHGGQENERRVATGWCCGCQTCEDTKFASPKGVIMLFRTNLNRLNGLRASLLASSCLAMAAGCTGTIEGPGTAGAGTTGGTAPAAFHTQR